ncbi:MFS transporter [Streptomyces sp. NPDC050704]|uniref:MFS transporter n=1 Tax=Streptomyces sp. NPDC050704 TaxID=3157219 RepID=UPI00341E8BD4
MFPYPSALKNSSFRLLWTSSTVSGLGSWLLVVALPFHVFQLTGSPAATGLTLALEALPALLIGPWAGTLLDRWNPVRAMWLADLASAGAVALILLADDAADVWLIYVAVLGESVATTVCRPAARALTPAVLGTGPELVTANALNALTGSVLRLVVPPLGALLLAGPGITSVLLVDIASYLVSAVLIAGVGRRIPSRTPPEGERNTLAGLAAELRAGLTCVIRTPSLRGPLAANGVFLTANAALTVLLVPFVTGHLNAPGYTVGYLVSGLGAGFIAGSAVSRRVIARFSTRHILGTAQLANGAAYFALFNAPNLPTAIAAAALIGLPGSILLITVETHIQRTAPPTMLGRIGAIFFSVDSLAAVVGALCAPALVATLGLTPALNTISALALTAVPVLTSKKSKRALSDRFPKGSERSPRP